MDLQALQAFITVVDAGSFSQAAESLHLTQPAVSKRLANLESQIGTGLIDRGQRQLRLTEAGQRLLPHARRILDEVHNARQEILNLDKAVSGNLPLIASHHIGLHHLPGWLQRFSRRYPAVNLKLQFMDSEKALAHMQRLEGELAFVTLNDAMAETFEIYHRWPDPMCFVCGSDHPLAQIPAPVIADLEPYNGLLPDADTETHRVVNRLFLEADVRLRAQSLTNYLETIKVMVSVGLGWSVLPRTMLDDSLHALPLEVTVSRVLGAVGLRRRQLGRAAQALLEIVAE